MIIVVSGNDPSTCPGRSRSIPAVSIVIIYPGTSPKDMEELVVKPIEKKSVAEDIKRIKTQIDDGVAVIEVEYKYESDVDSKYQELVREVNSLRPTLPQDIYKLEIRKVTPTDVNVLQVALISENASNEKMKLYGKALKEELEKLKSLKKVEYWEFLNKLSE
jgi:multidrug efflux pump subunit AcrB